MGRKERKIQRGWQHRRWQLNNNPKADLAVFMNSTKIAECGELPK